MIVVAHCRKEVQICIYPSYLTSRHWSAIVTVLQLCTCHASSSRSLVASVDKQRRNTLLNRLDSHGVRFARPTVWLECYCSFRASSSSPFSSPAWCPGERHGRRPSFRRKQARFGGFLPFYQSCSSIFMRGPLELSMH